MKPRTSRIAQAVTMVEFLEKHPDSTITEIQDELAAHYAHPSGASNIIAYTRNIVGEEILVCQYVPRRQAFCYKLALTVGESHSYMIRRKAKVRNEANNLVGMLDRIEEKWPGDTDVRMARVMLASVVNLLDAGPL